MNGLPPPSQIILTDNHFHIPFHSGRPKTSHIPPSGFFFKLLNHPFFFQHCPTSRPDLTTTYKPLLFYLSFFWISLEEMLIFFFNMHSLNRSEQETLKKCVQTWCWRVYFLFNTPVLQLWKFLCLFSVNLIFSYLLQYSMYFIGLFGPSP